MLKIIKKLKKVKLNRGMTYVELIVVLSIFAIMASVSIFNYRSFQSKVDIKNLANDIALQVVQAQKDAVSGKLPPTALLGALSGISAYMETWKPSYGVYFDTSPLVGGKSFYYFADISQLKGFNYDFSNQNCLPNGECISKLDISNNYSVSELKVFDQGSPAGEVVTNLAITFTRPNSGATFSVSNGDEDINNVLSGIDYAQIKVSNTDGSSAAYIEVYSSGRIQITNAPTEQVVPPCVPPNCLNPDDNTQVQ